MKHSRRAFTVIICIGILAAVLSACGASREDNRKIIRIGHNQATDHPTNIALIAFEEYIETMLGDKYNVEIYPSELLGSQTDMVQLTQTGAIDFCVASNSFPLCARPRRTCFLSARRRRWRATRSWRILHCTASWRTTRGQRSSERPRRQNEKTGARMPRPCF